MRFLHLAPLLAAVLLTVACGGAATTASSSPTDAPAKSGKDSQASGDKVDLDALQRRELAGLPPTHEVKAPDGSWSISVPSLSAPKLSESGRADRITMSIGTEAPFECLIHKRAIDVGGTIAPATTSTAKVAFKGITPITVVAAGTVPVLLVRGIYVVEQAPGKKAAGELKLAVAAHHAWAIACQHDELGYEETMATMMRDIVKSFRFKTDKKTTYESLSIMSVGKQAIGFERLAVFRSPDNKVILQETGTISIPKSKAVFAFLDYVTVQSVDRSGRLIKGAWVNAINGELEIKVALEHLKRGKHAVSGTADGKPIKGELTTSNRRALPGIVLRAKELRAKLKPGAIFDSKRFIPTESPTKLTIVSYTVDGNNGSRYSNKESNGTVITRVADERGMTERGEIKLADGSVLTVQRVATAGKP